MRLKSVYNLRPGDSIAKSVYDSFGRILLVKGTPLSPDYIQRLDKLGYASVYIDDGLPESIQVDDVVSDETRNEVFKITRETLLGARAGKSIQEGMVKQAVNDIIDEILCNREVIVHLTDIRSMQDHTFGHSVNVCILSVMTGLSIGYNQLKLKELAVGALLHDVGKAMLLDEVNHDGRLTEQSYKLIQKHCDYGFDILKKTDNISILAAHVAWQHHERYDGTGYPRKLSGKGILEFARIVAVADVYDALAGDRPYRERILPHEVISIIESKMGSDFDPDIVGVFVPNVAPYATGQLVALNSGFKAVVVSTTKRNPTRPKVKLLYDNDGREIKGLQIVDLMSALSLYITDVIKNDDEY